MLVARARHSVQGRRRSRMPGSPARAPRRPARRPPDFRGRHAAAAKHLLPQRLVLVLLVRPRHVAARLGREARGHCGVHAGPLDLGAVAAALA
jgi:hypothetical protein